MIRGLAYYLIESQTVHSLVQKEQLPLLMVVS
ncbi:hypothetical protein XM75_c20002 [Vibrio vulnificus]|nr:hypothetical protein XM75_c20002 [Vibrio vulnificus]